MTHSLSIILEGIELRGRCGVTAEERASARRWSSTCASTRSRAARPERRPRRHGQLRPRRRLRARRRRGRRVPPARAPRHGDLRRRSGTSSTRCWSRWPSTQDGAAGRAAHPRGARRGGAHRVSTGAGTAPRAAAARLRVARLQPRRPGGVPARRARSARGAARARAVVAASRIYETAPQDLEDQAAFLNQVVCLETGLQPLDLLYECQRIEREHGRVRELRFGPRTLDIDILLFQDVESDDPELTLPHPRMVKRAFVLVPLAEVWELRAGACRTWTSPGWRRADRPRPAGEAVRRHGRVSGDAMTMRGADGRGAMTRPYIASRSGEPLHRRTLRRAGARRRHRRPHRRHRRRAALARRAAHQVHVRRHHHLPRPGRHRRGHRRGGFARAALPGHHRAPAPGLCDEEAVRVLVERGPGPRARAHGDLPALRQGRRADRARARGRALAAAHRARRRRRHRQRGLERPRRGGPRRQPRAALRGRVRHRPAHRGRPLRRRAHAQPRRRRAHAQRRHGDRARHGRRRAGVRTHHQPAGGHRRRRRHGLPRRRRHPRPRVRAVPPHGPRRRRASRPCSSSPRRCAARAPTCATRPASGS